MKHKNNNNNRNCNTPFIWMFMNDKEIKLNGSTTRDYEMSSVRKRFMIVYVNYVNFKSETLSWSR